MSMVTRVAEDAALQRLQQATRNYARAWQTPLVPLLLAGGTLLAGAALLHRDPSSPAGRLLLTYAPLAWAAAQWLATRAWAPPLGEVVESGYIPRYDRVLSSLLLAGTNIFEATRASWGGAHLAASTLGTLALLWATRPLPGMGFVVVLLGPMVVVNPRPAGLLLAAVYGGALIVLAPFIAYRRRRVTRRLARELGEARTLEPASGSTSTDSRPPP